MCSLTIECGALTIECRNLGREGESKSDAVTEGGVVEAHKEDEAERVPQCLPCLGSGDE